MRFTSRLLEAGERRVDGRDKVSGRTKYTADYTRAGMLWAAFVASPYPRARIVAIDAAAARAMAGVRAVLTGGDIGPRYFGFTLKDWPVLAYERVNFVGEYVVAVAADTRAIAEAAAATIAVTYEELPAMLDPAAAIADGAEPVHPNDATFVYNAPARPPRPHRNMQGYDLVRKGDPEAAFARAAHVFEHTFHTPRYHGGYLEPRATLVWIESGGTVHVMCSNRNPLQLRDRIALTFDLAKEQVVIEPSFIGGEFGAKAVTIEEFPLYCLARATGRPVKHVRPYVDDVRATNVRHASSVRLRIATAPDGTIAALDVRALFDGGAYAGAKAGLTMLPGRTPKLPYKIPSARIERITAYTNTVPGGYMRAPGDMQIVFGLESLMDTIAGDLGIDPIELRLRNAATDGDTDLEGNVLAEPRLREILTELRAATHWEEPLPTGHGRGIALTARHFADGRAALTVTAHPNGEISVLTGSPEQGTGTLTVIARVLAAELGIEPERITVARGSSDVAPYDLGLAGSRSTVLLGLAAVDAARKLRALREQPHDGPITVTGEGVYTEQRGGPVWAEYGAYGVELSVDRETGALSIHDVVFVTDRGAIINPVAHRGQIDGGFAMGLGHALTEELRVEDGYVVNAPLSGYKLPTQRDMPPFRVVELPPGGGPGPYGARAVGEGGVPGVAPAIANAVAAACGARVDRLALNASTPCSIRERRNSACEEAAQNGRRSLVLQQKRRAESGVRNEETRRARDTANERRLTSVRMRKARVAPGPRLTCVHSHKVRAFIQTE
jgi:CO/xanthine dehydrogenase Mo-binding subunit